jgi:hypothetical protein
VLEKLTGIKCSWQYLFGYGPLFVFRLVLVNEIPQVVSFLIFNVDQKMFLSAIEKLTGIKCSWRYLFVYGPIFVSRLVRWTRFLGGQFSHI